jgi:hypothetical protein
VDGGRARDVAHAGRRSGRRANTRPADSHCGSGYQCRFRASSTPGTSHKCSRAESAGGGGSRSSRSSRAARTRRSANCSSTDECRRGQSTGSSHQCPQACGSGSPCSSSVPITGHSAHCSSTDECHRGQATCSSHQHSSRSGSEHSCHQCPAGCSGGERVVSRDNLTG